MLLFFTTEKVTDENDYQLFKDAVYSLSNLSAHIGIISPNLVLLDILGDKTCKYEENKTAIKDLKIKADDGQVIGKYLSPCQYIYYYYKFNLFKLFASYV